MCDRKKIIKGLEYLDWYFTCDDGIADKDAQKAWFELQERILKKQEPMPMLEVEDDDLYAWSPEDISYYCPRPECGKEISYDYHFCPYCGQAVKLNEIN